jgi:hypothetical protein
MCGRMPDKRRHGHSDTWIREQLDQMPPEQFRGIFTSTLEIAGETGLVKGRRVLDGGALIALDGDGIMHRKRSIARGVRARRRAGRRRITIAPCRGSWRGPETPR